MFKTLREDIDGFLARDPAARSRFEVLLAYPGLHAMIFYRLAHGLWRRGWRLPARLVSQVGRAFTGVEIHPGATIGRRLMIDHGSGVVIGETAEIGDNVMIYHGVTLGGRTLNPGKRHPTVEDEVIIGAGAAVLGPVTVGRGARVGANAVVLTDVPTDTTMVGVPARPLKSKSVVRQQFCAYGLPEGDSLPDPVARAMDSLRDQLCEALDRLETLEKRLDGDTPAARDDGNTVVDLEAAKQARTPDTAAEDEARLWAGGGI